MVLKKIGVNFGIKVYGFGCCFKNYLCELIDYYSKWEKSILKYKILVDDFGWNSYIIEKCNCKMV